LYPELVLIQYEALRHILSHASLLSQIKGVCAARTSELLAGIVSQPLKAANIKAAKA
jgi:hypothetical protein